MPVPPVIDIPVEIQAPFASSQSFDSSQLAIPLELEGSVESFDPVARAADLAATLPRQWCGNYTSFTSNSTVDVELTLTRLKPMGQMVDLRGEMRIGTISTPCLLYTSDAADE